MATSRYIIQNEHKYKDNKFLLPLLIAFFFGLGVAFSAGGFNYGRIFAIALAGITCLLNVEDAFCSLVFAFPFSSMLKISVETIAILPVLYVIIIFKILIKGKVSVPPVSLFCVFVFGILQALNIVLYEAIYFSIISIFLNACFVLFVSHYMDDCKESTYFLLPKASFYFATGTSLMLLLSDIFPKLPVLVLAEQVDAEQISHRYAATMADANELAQTILIAVGLLIAVFPSLKSIPKKVFAVIMMAYLAITGIRTHSKSYAITILALFAFLMVIYIRFSAKRDGLSKTLTKLLPILLLAIIGFILILTYVVIPIFESRSEEQTSFWTNRDSIWVKYLYALLHRFDVMLIGCGAGNVTRVIQLAGGFTTVVPHNSYLEYVVQFGMLGLALLFTAWKQAMTSVKSKFNTYYVIPLAAFLITAFGISVNANDCLFILIALLSLPLPESSNRPLVQRNK